MIKRVLITLLLLLLIAYLTWAVGWISRRPEAQVCSGVLYDVQDSVYAHFISDKELTTLLKRANLDPTGRLLDEVNTQQIEESIAEHPLIDEVECYKTPSGRLRIDIRQRIPILRVMDQRGGNYFVDTKGKVMPGNAHCIARLPVATGHVSRSMATGDLYHFAQFLHEDEFWDAQVEQIHLLSSGDVELVPRVGNHIIFMGKIKGYEKKLKRLKAFYRKGLNKVGWNRYSRISVEFSNQVICTRREKK